MAHALTAPGSPLVESIAAEFGREFVRSNGTLDRRKLARHVFADPDKMARLNAITHPPILAAVAQMIEEARRGKSKIICLVAPLLFEFDRAGMPEPNKILVMKAERAERIRRVVERDDLTEEEIEQRMAAQMPEAEQMKRADWVIDTTAGEEQARSQLDNIWLELFRA